MQHLVTRSLEQWTNLVSSSFVPLNAKANCKGSFAGSLALRSFDDVAVNQIEAAPQIIERTSQLIDESSSGYYKIGYQQTGTGVLFQDKKEVILEPGQFVMYDTSRPYTLGFDENFRTTVIMVPRGVIESDGQDFSQFSAVKFGEGHQLSSAISQLMGYVGDSLVEVNESVGNRLSYSIIDLLKAVLGEELRSGPQPVWRLGCQDGPSLSTILDFIDENLAYPGLTPRYIAEAYYMSLRSLHHLFEKHNNTAAATIRMKRLAQCRNDLLSDSKRSMSVAAIGARWGIHDPAYFSRLFKRHYGISPSEFRYSNLR